MNARVPYYPDTKIPSRGSQLFYVDPNRTNEGLVPAVPGSLINYRYKLPFLAHSFPVRSLRLLYPSISLDVVPALYVGTNSFLTLRKADGTYLLDRVPLSMFLYNVGAPPQRRPLLFDRNFFPDPRMSFVQWTIAGETGRVGIEFQYA